MTLLARRREELRQERTPKEPVEKRRSIAVRPQQPRSTFLHVQAALGNRATDSLLRSAPVLAKRQGEPLPARIPLSLDLRGGLAEPELDLVFHLAQTLRPATAEPMDTADRPRPGFLVPDGTTPGAGQMTRSGFLAAMRDTAREAAERGLTGTGHTARGCPWIEHYFRFYQRQSAERIEADLWRYMPSARSAANAQELLALAADHVQASVRHWAATGELVGVPRGLPGAGLIGALAGSLAAVQAQLGEGRPLESSARSRMERAFGTRFSEVRVHSGAAAARLARRLRARAFAVGPDVAFDRGEYRPGTVVGDALLAHELAHTLQQRGGAAIAGTAAAAPPRGEREADATTAAVLARLWSGAREIAGDFGRHALPRLHTGLALARCGRERFSDAELRNYLFFLKAHGITRSDEGDNKARAVVREIRGETGKFEIEDIHVQRLIEEMIDGPTLLDDEVAIFELLRRSGNARLKYLFTTGGLDPDDLLEHFSGPPATDLRAFFELRFEGGIQQLRDNIVHPQGKPYPDVELLANLQLDLLREEAKKKKLAELEKERKRREAEAKRRKEEGDDSPLAEPPLPSPADVKVETKDVAGVLGEKAGAEEEEEESTERWDAEEAKDGGASYFAFAAKTIDAVKAFAKSHKQYEEIADLMDLAPPRFTAAIAKEALKETWYAQRSGDEFQVSMSWLEDAARDPRLVFANIAHEVGGHLFLAKGAGKLGEKISDKVLEVLSEDERKELFADEKKRDAFHHAFTYPETEIFAELRERKYYKLGFGPSGDIPDEDIPEKIATLKKNWHPEVARAILTHVVDLARVTKGIRDEDVDFLIDVINSAGFSFQVH